MELTSANWRAMLSCAATVLKANADSLSKLDSVIGDGDHGVTINKIALKIEECLANWQEDTMPVSEFLETTGYKIMDISGGSAGPLWGNLFTGFAEGVQEMPMDEAAVKKMFAYGLSAMQEISNAKVGDKTMMDALIPATQAVADSTAALPELFTVAAVAAKAGADKTVDYMAKFGRAKNLKEKSLGHKDPGAVSLSLLFEAFAQAL